MRAKFSSSWKASSQPRKQRKYRYNAPFHTKHKFLSAHLSAELRKKHGKRSIPAKKGDEVLVMRGSFAGKKGKIISVDLKEARLKVENITRSKKDGTKVSVMLHPSKVMITAMNMEDKKRINTGEKNAPNKI